VQRDAALVSAHAAGATQDQLARRFGMSPSGISRALERLGARRPVEDRIVAWRRAPRAGRPGPKPIWSDVPAHLVRDYHAIRAVIGSRAARDQLLAAEARRASEISISTQGVG
jgi:hypothetical protein